ncbi:MAG: peptidase S41 [Marinilabiliales bacterium]|nr:MAG: peptidase S41 [Marinilabiliales bacterium]
MRNIILSIAIFFSICTSSLNAQTHFNEMNQVETTKKMGTLLQIVNNFYVDTLDMAEVTEKAIIYTLKELDPHSAYISKEDVDKANEPLEGSFEGVGLTFQLFKDTILVISPIPGGPSDKVGIMAGDKIITVDGEDAFGEKIDNEWVMDHLRGKKGTEVTVGIYRKNNNDILDFTIVRDEIPINSMDAAFMLDKETGYIKLNRFAKNSLDEVNTALTELKSQGMQNLVFDLRGNSGGYLGTAMSITDEFLKDNELIVYTEGVNSPRQELDATAGGNFEEGKLVILINEGSASASEIVSGAVQDWDRGMIVGRRSFGKGLVQRPFKLPDGSIVRLTVARYYTPSGRCIQSPYDNGSEEYYNDFISRMETGELMHPDSISFPDSLHYETKGGRTVYGGGGIMPDIFVPFDTLRYNRLLTSLIRKGVINSFVNEYLDDNRKLLLKKYPDFDKYNDSFQFSDAAYNEFIELGEKEKVLTEENKSDLNESFVRLQLKALIARNLYETGSYFEVLAPTDHEINKALELIKEETTYESFGLSQ